MALSKTIFRHSLGYSLHWGLFIISSMEEAAILVFVEGNKKCIDVIWAIPLAHRAGETVLGSFSLLPWMHPLGLLSASYLPFVEPGERADESRSMLLREPGSWEVLARKERKLAAAAALTSLPSSFLVDQECNSFVTAAHCRLADITPCHRSSKCACRTLWYHFSHCFPSRSQILQSCSWRSQEPNASKLIPHHSWVRLTPACLHSTSARNRAPGRY